MKAVILAGGLGTRISEETGIRPKPMIEIGGMPILWHVMKIYASHGINDFIVCLGYKGYMIKEYFTNYFLHTSDVTIDLSNNSLEVHSSKAEPWRVTLVDTGPDTMTGGRIKRIASYLDPDELFCVTYGDGVGNVDITACIEQARSSEKAVTLTATLPDGRFGALELDGSDVKAFREKPRGEGGWINGGFFVVHPKVLEYIDGDSTVWEQGPLERLALEGNLGAYMHEGFWHPLDTVRDKKVLERLWDSGKAPWKTWQ